MLICNFEHSKQSTIAHKVTAEELDRLRAETYVHRRDQQKSETLHMPLTNGRSPQWQGTIMVTFKYMSIGPCEILISSHYLGEAFFCSLKVTFTFFLFYKFTFFLHGTQQNRKEPLIRFI